MVRRFALLGVTLLATTLLTGCVVVQPKPDGTFGVSFLPPSSLTTITASSSGGGATSTVGSGGATSANASSSQRGTPGRPAYPGKTLKSGPWTVTVENTEWVKRLEDGSKARSGKRFLVVNVAIRNIAVGAALTVLPNQFALWSPSNKVVDPYPTKLGIYNARSVRPIPAAMGGFTSFVYEVPINPTIYTLTMTPRQGATGSMSWYVP
jgi:hypothetical protein